MTIQLKDVCFCPILSSGSTSLPCGHAIQGKDKYWCGKCGHAVSCHQGLKNAQEKEAAKKSGNK